jgi:hypothetical protein
VQALEQALARFEAVLADREPLAPAGAPVGLTELKGTVVDLAQRLEAALEQLASQATLLSHQASRFTDVAGRLEGRLAELVEVIDRLESAPSAPAAATEPQFAADGRAVRIVLAAVPGFQGLMEAQRALNGLRAAQAASVVAYKNGEAALEVTLREPVTAREIVERLRASTGHQLLIEEARPEALRLRLRFVE